MGTRSPTRDDRAPAPLMRRRPAVPVRRRPAVLVAAGLLAGGLLAGGALAGCAQGSGTQPTAGGTVSTTPTGPSGPTSPGRSSPPGFPVSAPPGSKTYPAGEVTLTGLVEAGVEYGCLVLTADGTTYTLVGGDRSVLRAGTRVVVRGRPNPTLVTTCQQGVAFEVSEAHPA